MPGRNLTESEFKTILQRAAELEHGTSGEDRPALAFTHEEFLEAAHDLEIGPAALARAHRAHFAGVALAAAVERPFDTKIEVTRAASVLAIMLPAAGWGSAAESALGSAVFFLVFTVLWTWITLHGMPLFALASLPLWFKGLRLLWDGIALLTVRTQLCLTRESGMLIKRLGPFTRRVALDPAHLKLRAPKDEPTAENPPEVILEYGTRTYDLLAEFSGAERLWVFTQLRSWLTDS